jgi:hypothetical protein
MVIFKLQNGERWPITSSWTVWLGLHCVQVDRFLNCQTASQWRIWEFMVVGATMVVTMWEGDFLSASKLINFFSHHYKYSHIFNRIIPHFCPDLPVPATLRVQCQLCVCNKIVWKNLSHPSVDGRSPYHPPQDPLLLLLLNDDHDVNLIRLALNYFILMAMYYCLIFCTVVVLVTYHQSDGTADWWAV